LPRDGLAGDLNRQVWFERQRYKIARMRRGAQRANEHFDIFNHPNSQKTMKRFACRFGPILVVLLLSACSATGPKFSLAAQPAKTEALVYLYRPDAPYYGGIQSHFYVDGNKVASLNKEGYSALYLSPGVHMFKQHWTGMDNAKDTVQFQLELEPGETRYYRLTIALKSFGIAPAYRGLFISANHAWAIANVEELEALNEIRLTHYQPPFDIKGVRKIGTD
jgi:hypothetical protein